MVCLTTGIHRIITQDETRFTAKEKVVRLSVPFMVYDGLSDLWISDQVGKAVRQAGKDANAMRNAIDI